MAGEEGYLSLAYAAPRWFAFGPPPPFRQFVFQPILKASCANRNLLASRVNVDQTGLSTLKQTQQERRSVARLLHLSRFAVERPAKTQALCCAGNYQQPRQPAQPDSFLVESQ
jgi:hypothetical protein